MNKELQSNNKPLVALDDKEGRLKERDRIETFQEAMRAHVGDSSGARDAINSNGLVEFITGGAYTRILDIPAGTTIVSELWKRERLWIIIQGEVKIITEQGEQHIVAPYIAQAPYGSKVALFAVKDTKWAAVTGIETKDLSEVKDEAVVDTYSDLTYPWEQLENK